MNRIRKFGTTYQVLITPTQVSNAGFELLRGDLSSFDDSFLRNYTVLTFNTMAEAQVEAFNYPDIDWDSLVLLHNNAYVDLRELIKQDLDAVNINIIFEPHMMTSLELKDTVFNRVIRYGERFNLSYNMNDVISFNIVNMWTKNLDEIASHLVNDFRLRIRKVKRVSGIIILMGITEVSSAYEIRLIPTVFDQYIKWMKKNDITNTELKQNMLEKCLKQQAQIDNGPVVR